MRYLVLLLAMLTACSDTVTAPVSDCTNELKPPTFRLVLSTGDTLPRVANHYLEPHRNADTFTGIADDGRRVSFAVGYPAGYCLTALDSASWSTNHTKGFIE